MPWLPSFVAWPYALAGAVATLAPILLHLWKRPPRREIHWPAMEFLFQAAEQHRTWRRWRELLLLACRVAALLLFGLALAGPYFPVRNGLPQRDTCAAIVILDNSLSMARQVDGVSHLERARRRAGEFIRRLPTDARVVIAPWCGQHETQASDAAEPRPLPQAEAIEALGRIGIVEQAPDKRSPADEDSSGTRSVS